MKGQDQYGSRAENDKRRQQARKAAYENHTQSLDGQQHIGGRKMDRNNLTSQNVYEVMSQYAHCMSGHRNICRIIDYEISEKLQTGLQLNTAPDQSIAHSHVENSVYVISESYNLSLFDLYCTNQAEKTNFSEEFLIETSF